MGSSARAAGGKGGREREASGEGEGGATGERRGLGSARSSRWAAARVAVDARRAIEARSGRVGTRGVRARREAAREAWADMWMDRGWARWRMEGWNAMDGREVIDRATRVGLCSACVVRILPDDVEQDRLLILAPKRCRRRFGRLLT